MSFNLASRINNISSYIHKDLTNNIAEIKSNITVVNAGLTSKQDTLIHDSHIVCVPVKANL